MTEPVITDAEVEALADAVTLACRCDRCMADVRKALAAFLKARVPDAINPETERHKADGFTPREVSLVCLVHNACRDAVLAGPATHREGTDA